MSGVLILSTKINRIHILYLIIGLAVATLFVCVYFGGLGILSELSENQSVPLPRDSDVPAAQAEMKILVETVLVLNPDTLLETRVPMPVRAGSDMFADCIEGLTELIYQSYKSLDEVALIYANGFDTEVRRNLIDQVELDEVYYDVLINGKAYLLLSPINSLMPLVAPDLATLYPVVCKERGSCYKVGVYYSDPSTQSCRP